MRVVLLRLFCILLLLLLRCVLRNVFDLRLRVRRPVFRVPPNDAAPLEPA